MHTSMSSAARLAALVLLALTAACGDQEREVVTKMTAAPEPELRIDVVDLAGLKAGVDEYRGKPLLVNLWAMWCEPCVEELPELVEVAHEFEGRAHVVGISYDLQVFGSSVEKTLPRLTTFVAERMGGLPNLVFDEDDQDGINALWDLPGPIPVTLAFDAQGNLVDRQEGPAGADRFREMIRAAGG